MVTVFAILLIVIYLSKLLIVLINKYGPEEIVTAKMPAESVVVSPTIMKIISATVSKVTSGKGIVKSVEKL